MCDNSIWENNLDRNSFPSLKEDIKTDVLIIGGGITGILLAHFLHNRGVDYVLVEKERIFSGVTNNTTAKITVQHGLIYQKLLKSFGIDIARGYYNANNRALEHYKTLCRDIECDFEFKDNFVYSTDDISKIHKELEALNELGIEAAFSSKLPLPVKNEGAVCFKQQAQFNPLKFLNAISQNLNIYEHTKVLEMVGNTAKTPFGSIKADRVAVCTHFPFINKHGLYFLKMYQHRSYVLALKGAQKVGGMYVDEDNKGLSFRNYGDVLLLGGGGHRTGKQGGGYAELRRFANKNYKNAKEIAHYATQDCETLDSVAYIGHYSNMTDNLFTATGFNKWGMTTSMVAAELLSDILTDTANEFAEIFNPSRSILRPQLIVNAFETTVNLLTPTTKRCPHLGCALKWNKQEHSFDCACHGSRFSENGKLLNGPATDDIKN